MAPCKTTPYPWNSTKVAKSPFRTLKTAKNVERRFHRGNSVGFTARSSLKSQGRVPRANGCYMLGSKYASRTRKTRR
jgi:hypothetical protein